MIGTILTAILPSIGRTLEQAVPDRDLRHKLETDIKLAVMANEADITKAAASVVMAEVQGEGWLQRSWRPMLMVWFALLVGAYWFGATPPNLSEARVEDLFDLVKIGVGGYVVGRSGEKIAKHLKGGDPR